MNPPTHLDPSHARTRFSADQMIQFAPAVGLEVSLASYSMLEDLLLKARGGSGAHPMTSRYPTEGHHSRLLRNRQWPIVLLPGQLIRCLPLQKLRGDVIGGEGVAEEPCSSRQADARLAMGCEGSGRAGTDSLETLQQIKSSQKKKKSRSCKWSREGRLNPLLPCGDDKSGYVFTEETLELDHFAKVFKIGSEDPLENKYCF